jgi:hypothetical protein
MGGACGTYGGQHKYIQGFGAETSGRRPLGRRRSRWKYNIKMDLSEPTTELIWLRTGTNGEPV